MGQRQSKDGKRRGKKGQAAVSSGDGGAQQASAATSSGKTLKILHFNDVYNIEASDTEPISGAARLAGLIKTEGGDPMVLFSGDAFSPSVMSTVTLGSHMPPVLNTFGIHAACIGNHDFDLGLATCRALVQKCNFPWMMSNVRDKETGQLLGGLHETLMLEHGGVRVGLMGLVEHEWLDTLAALDPAQLDYTDFVAKGTELAAKLRAEGAELVVALTHMREPNDRLLASKVEGIDLVLGGHDHNYVVDTIAPYDTLLVKSGTDFRELTRIEVTLPPESGPQGSEAVTRRPTFHSERIPVALDSPQHPDATQVVDEYASHMCAKLDQVVGATACPLDARFTTIRARESNMGNLVADILRESSDADIVICNSGTLRSDQVHPAGPLCVRDIIELLPMPDSMVVLQATGAQVVEALENGVSQVPRLEGRFPQVSGVRFRYDSRKPAGSRVLRDSVYVLQEQHPTGDDDTPAGPPQWVHIDLEKAYKVAVKSYMAEGKDGYDVLEKCKVLVSDEDGVVVSQALRNHFRSLAVLNMWDPKVKAAGAAQKWIARAKDASSSSLSTHPEPQAKPDPPSASLTAQPQEAQEPVERAASDAAVPPAAATPAVSESTLPPAAASPAASASAGAATGEAAKAAVAAPLSPAASAPPVLAPDLDPVLEEQAGGQQGKSMPSHARMLRACPTRIRLHTGDTGLCVLSVERGGYVVKPVVEGRIVDAASEEQPAAA